MGQTEKKRERRAAVEDLMATAIDQAKKNFPLKKGNRFSSSDTWHRRAVLGVLEAGEPKQWYYDDCPGVRQGMLVTEIHATSVNASGSNKAPNIQVTIFADLKCETCGRHGQYDGYNARLDFESALPGLDSPLP